MRKKNLCGRDKTPPDRAIGWTCTREKGHDGPCAMVPPKRSFWDELGEAIGEALFGGNR